MNIESLNLTRFEDYGSKISRKISINRSFSFGIPPTLYSENGISSFTHAILFYDEQQKVVGINFVSNPVDKQGFALVTYGDGTQRGASFVARSFFNKYNIDPNVYHGRYDFKIKKVDDIGDVYLIELLAAKTDNTNT